jgi:hypothetical protein
MDKSDDLVRLKLPEETVESGGRKLFLGLTKKQWVLYGSLGIVLVVLYSIGSYYMLASRNKTPGTSPTRTMGPSTSVINDTPIVSEPTLTPIPTATESAQAEAAQNTYKNDTYDLKFTYPKDLKLSFNKTTDKIDPYLMMLTASQKKALTIEVQDPAYVGQSDLESRTIIQMNLKDFAAKKWSLNKDYKDSAVSNRKVGSLKTTTFLGKPAYSFTVTGSRYDDRVYEVLSEEYTFLFTQNDGYKIIIVYPSDDSALTGVLETISFY